MVRGRDALDQLITLGVTVQAVIQFRLGDVVRLHQSFLAVSVRRVFTQHADTARLNHVRVDAIPVRQLDESAVVHQRPSKSH